MTTSTPRPTALPKAPARPVRRASRRTFQPAVCDLPLFHAFRG
jgi:hypothetical protein